MGLFVVKGRGSGKLVFFFLVEVRKKKELEGEWGGYF